MFGASFLEPNVVYCTLLLVSFMFRLKSVKKIVCSLCGRFRGSQGGHKPQTSTLAGSSGLLEEHIEPQCTRTPIQSFN